MLYLLDMDSITTQHNVSRVLGFSPTPRICVIIFNVIFITLGLGLNLLVVISGVKGVMKIDLATRMFITNIALTDMAIVVVSFFPMLATLVADRWVLGPALCFLSAHLFQKAPFVNEMLMITSMSFYRLWFIKQPSSVRQMIKTRWVMGFMLGCLLVSCLPSLISILLQNTAKFDPLTLNCVIVNQDSVLYVTYSMALIIIFLVLPMTLVLLINIALLYVVVKYGGKTGKLPHQRTLVTISCVCWAFLLSYVPVLIGLLMRALGHTLPPWFTVLFNQVNYIDVVANPFIYTITNSRFRHLFKKLSIEQYYYRYASQQNNRDVVRTPSGITNIIRNKVWINPEAGVMKESLV